MRTYADSPAFRYPAIVLAPCLLLLSLASGCSGKNQTLDTLLMDKGLPETKTRDLSEAGDRLHYPAGIALSAFGQKSPERQNTEATKPDGEDWAADTVTRYLESPSSEKTLSKDRLETLLKCSFSAQGSPTKLINDRKIRKELIRLAVDKAKDDIAPVSPEQAKEAAALIKSGEFYRDIAGSLLAVSQFTRLTPAIVGALPEDLRRTLSDGDLDPLRTFFGNTGARETANLTKALLSKESIRLAILIYARVHGINISDKDLDTVEKALDPDAGADLQPLLADGISAMETHYGLDETKKRLNVMGSGSDKGCNI